MSIAWTVPHTKFAHSVTIAVPCRLHQEGQQYQLDVAEDLLGWCRHNLAGNFTYECINADAWLFELYNPNEVKRALFEWTFASEEEAILFKLRWS